MNQAAGNNDNEKVSFTFKKSERLCSKKTIDKLFAEGKPVFVYPVKIVFIEIPLKSNTPAQVAFAVSKKNFKRAVDRNLLKRRLREAYRLHKPDFYEALKEFQVAVFFVYTAKDIADFAVIESAMIKGLKKLAREIQSKSNYVK